MSPRNVVETIEASKTNRNYEQLGDGVPSAHVEPFLPKFSPLDVAVKALSPRNAVEAMKKKRDYKQLGGDNDGSVLSNNSPRNFAKADWIKIKFGKPSPPKPESKWGFYVGQIVEITKESDEFHGRKAFIKDFTEAYVILDNENHGEAYRKVTSFTEIKDYKNRKFQTKRRNPEKRIFCATFETLAGKTFREYGEIYMSMPSGKFQKKGLYSCEC